LTELFEHAPASRVASTARPRANCLLIYPFSELEKSTPRVPCTAALSVGGSRSRRG
jgi:hypothetical protein